MWLRKASDFMGKGLSPVIPVVGKIGAGIIGVMMLLTVADVMGRYIFNHPIQGALELSEFMLVLVVFFTMAHCEFLRGHVKIDIVVSRLHKRPQDVIDGIMYFFFLVTIGLLSWRLYLYGMADWQNNVVSGTLGVAVAPFIFLGAFGCALLGLVVLRHFLLFIAEALRK